MIRAAFKKPSLEVIENCTFADVKVDNLPSFDIEYIFLKIRSKSVGEKVELNVTCPDDGETKVDYELNIDEIKVKKIDGHTNVIMLTDEIGITMKYPNLGMPQIFSGASGGQNQPFEQPSAVTVRD